MKEQYEHGVTFHSVLRAEKPSGAERSAGGPQAAGGQGTQHSPQAALADRRPHVFLKNFHARGKKTDTKMLCHHSCPS
uniref:Uncharacterized protein n=1 Tax=Apteryx owenii TaxID=8824 RepID=A0A8B9S9D0_APTOW